MLRKEWCKVVAPANSIIAEYSAYICCKDHTYRAVSPPQDIPIGVEHRPCPRLQTMHGQPEQKVILWSGVMVRYSPCGGWTTRNVMGISFRPCHICNEGEAKSIRRLTTSRQSDIALGVSLSELDVNAHLFRQQECSISVSVSISTDVRRRV